MLEPGLSVQQSHSVPPTAVQTPNLLTPTFQMQPSDDLSPPRSSLKAARSESSLREPAPTQPQSSRLQALTQALCPGFIR